MKNATIGSSPCGRCGGKGVYFHFGTCFRCIGSGVVATRAEKARLVLAEKVAKQQAEYEARRLEEYNDHIRAIY